MTGELCSVRVSGFEAEPSSDRLGDLDTIIASVPEKWFVGEAVMAKVVAADAMELANYVANLCERRLHHAEFVVTDDPRVIEERGLLHDCTSCRADVDQALAYMSEHHGEALVVGNLWYVPEPVE